MKTTKQSTEEPGAVVPVAVVEVVPPVDPKNSRRPMAVVGTWDAARTWLNRARQMAEGALFCQVMTGLELLKLQKDHPETRGGDRSKSPPRGLLPFAETATKETGLGRSSVFKLIEMARAAVPRLRKYSRLRGFDPTASAIGLLPAPQQEALTAAVRKLTDGLTQGDFLTELGLAKAPQGSGATGGARNVGPQEKLSAEDKAAMMAKAAREDFGAAVKAFEISKARFTLLPDEEILGQIEYLERQVRARRTWLSLAVGTRNPTRIKALLAGGE